MLPHGVQLGDGLLKVRWDAPPNDIREAITLHGRTLSARHRVLRREQARLAHELVEVRDALGCDSIQVAVSPEKAQTALRSLAKEATSLRAHAASLSEVVIVIEESFGIDVTRSAVTIPWRLPKGSLEAYLSSGTIASFTAGVSKHKHLAVQASSAARELEGLLGCRRVEFGRGLSPQACLDAAEILIEAAWDLSHSLDWSQVETLKVGTRFELNLGRYGGLDVSVPHRLHRDDIAVWIQELAADDRAGQGTAECTAPQAPRRRRRKRRKK